MGFTHLSSFLLYYLFVWLHTLLSIVHISNKLSISIFFMQLFISHQIISHVVSWYLIFYVVWSFCLLIQVVLQIIPRALLVFFLFALYAWPFNLLSDPRDNLQNLNHLPSEIDSYEVVSLFCYNLPPFFFLYPFNFITLSLTSSSNGKYPFLKHRTLIVCQIHYLSVILKFHLWMITVPLKKTVHGYGCRTNLSVYLVTHSISLNIICLQIRGHEVK